MMFECGSGIMDWRVRYERSGPAAEGCGLVPVRGLRGRSHPAKTDMAHVKKRRTTAEP
ncbi:hypothetical protein HMPREF3039_01450 [Akkermansia sp. KLE1798]|nr:hypothetical protein HMPREF3039_01450 [Akkermansia sp. KLE1798]